MPIYSYKPKKNALSKRSRKNKKISYKKSKKQTSLRNNYKHHYINPIKPISQNNNISNNNEIELKRQHKNLCSFCNKAFEKSRVHPQFCMFNNEKYGSVRCDTPFLNNEQKNEIMRIIPSFEREVNDENAEELLNGVFETFVIDIQNSSTIFGEKTFLGMSQHLKYLFNSSQITEDEEEDFYFTFIYPFQIKYEEFISLVLINGEYKEISGSGTKKLSTPRDWAAAIRNLIRILTLANQAFTIQLNKFMDPEQRKQRCKAITKLDECKIPCSIKSSLKGKYCTYKI